jgi:WD40 repeat protein
MSTPKPGLLPDHSIRFVLSMLLGLAVATSWLPAQQAKKDDKKPEPAKKEDKTKPEPKKEEKLTPPLLELKGHTDWINKVIYSPDGTRLATASRDHTVKVWDAAKGKDLLTLKGHAGNVKSVAYSPDGKKLASTSGKWHKDKKLWQGEIKIWDAASGKELQTLAGHSDEIESVAYSPDGKWLASAGKDRTIILWNAASGKEVNTLKGHGGEIESIAFSPDSKFLASVGGLMETKDKKTFTESGELKIWDVAAGKEFKTLKAASRALTSVVYGKEGKVLAAGSFDGTIHVWDPATGKEALTWKAPEGVLALAYSPNSQRVASGGWDKAVTLWDSGSGKEVIAFKGHTNSVSSVAYHPGGSQLASASLDQTVKIWSLMQPLRK